MCCTVGTQIDFVGVQGMEGGIGGRRFDVFVEYCLFDLEPLVFVR